MDRITAAEVFVRIAERGSLTAAAEALDMSRAMVTRYLAEMEQWAGARLLHRTTRRLSLTEAGEQTLARCRRMLDVASDMAVTPAAQVDTPRGLLRVACSQSLAEVVLASAVTEFLRRHPLAAIDLHIGARPVNLVEERIDLAIRITNDLDPNLIARPLGPCASVICAAPAYLAAHGSPARVQDLATHNCLTYSYFGKSLWEFDLAIRITNDLDPNLIARPLGPCASVICAAPAYLAAHGSPGRVQDLATHNCLTYSYFGKSLWEFDLAGERVAVPVSGSLSANESQVLLAAALEGAGIAMQPVYAASAAIAQGRLVELLPEAVPQRLGVYGLYASRRQMPASLRVFLDLLVERFADPNRWLLRPPGPRRDTARARSRTA